MGDFFRAIAWLFEQVLLSPYQFLTALELESWWLANGVNFLFLIVGFFAAAYWINQLRLFSDQEKESKDISAHSFL